MKFKVTTEVITALLAAFGLIYGTRLFLWVACKLMGVI